MYALLEKSSDFELFNEEYTADSRTDGRAFMCDTRKYANGKTNKIFFLPKALRNKCPFLCSNLDAVQGDDSNDRLFYGIAVLRGSDASVSSATVDASNSNTQSGFDESIPSELCSSKVEPDIPRNKEADQKPKETIEEVIEAHENKKATESMFKELTQSNTTPKASYDNPKASHDIKKTDARLLIEKNRLSEPRKICTFFMEGRCKYGDKCLQIHNNNTNYTSNNNFIYYYCLFDAFFYFIFGYILAFLLSWISNINTKYIIVFFLIGFIIHILCINHLFRIIMIFHHQSSYGHNLHHL
jgi:hypothetical protein